MKKVKKLLEESTIRQFMKYADIEPLAETFLDTVEEEEFYEEDDMEMGDDEPEMDMAPEPEMDMDEPAGDVDEEMVQRIVQAVADAIAEETGVDVDVEGGVEPEMDMAPEPEMDMEEEPAEESEEVDEGKMKYNREDDEELDEATEEEPVEESEEFDYESVVAEVSRRVALRLVKESKK